MVRTRSGKSTFKEVDDETTASSAESKPTVGKSPRSTNRKRVLTSPRLMKSNAQQPKSWIYGILKDLCVWRPTERTWSFWLYINGLFVLSIAAVSIYGETPSENLLLMALALALHAFDILTNFCNELLDSGHLNTMILFTECALNLSETFLLLWIVQQSSFLWVSLICLLSINFLSFNVKFKDDEKIWVRIMAYLILCVCCGAQYEFMQQHARLTAYAIFLLLAMLVDVADFPDRCFSLSVCDALWSFFRSVGFYMLLTQTCLSSEQSFTTYESFVWSFFN